MIEVSKLTKKIGKNIVLDGVSLIIREGEVTGFSGINGSGKTMLMRAVAGLVKPTAGSVRIDGKLLWSDASFPESIGFLIESPAFLGAYGGFRNLKMIASVKALIDDSQIKKTLTRVGLDPEDKRKYRKYSLGMKQRLGIAAAIMEDPAILILDEPTNALDADGIRMLESIVFDQRDRGASVILACHDRELLGRLSDVVYLVESGKVFPVRGGGEDV